MKALVEHIAKSLVDKPESVRVDEQLDGRTLSLRLMVHPDDMGRIIGKQGRTAKAMRSVVYAAAMAQNKRARLDIVE